MKLLFRQRMFSWFDSYDIYDEDGRTLFIVKGQLSWGHKLKIMNVQGEELGLVQEVVFSFLPRFELYAGGEYLGSLRKEFTFFRPRFTMDLNDWSIEGNWLEWDYNIIGSDGSCVATITKEPLHWTDTYVIDVANPNDALPALMVVLAIDAEKCSRD